MFWKVLAHTHTHPEVSFGLSSEMHLWSARIAQWNAAACDIYLLSRWSTLLFMPVNFGPSVHYTVSQYVCERMEARERLYGNVEDILCCPFLLLNDVIWQIPFHSDKRKRADITHVKIKTGWVSLLHFSCLILSHFFSSLTFSSLHSHPVSFAPPFPILCLTCSDPHFPLPSSSPLPSCSVIPSHPLAALLSTAFVNPINLLWPANEKKTLGSHALVSAGWGLG